MGWDYRSSTLYGVEVNSRATGREIVESICNSPLVTKVVIDTYMPYGDCCSNNVFLGIESQTSTYEDGGSYAFSHPDTIGNEYHGPRHPTYNKKDKSRKSPKLSDEEQAMIQRILKECVCIDKEPVWWKYGLVYY